MTPPPANPCTAFSKTHNPLTVIPTILNHRTEPLNRHSETSYPSFRLAPESGV